MYKRVCAVVATTLGLAGALLANAGPATARSTAPIQGTGTGTADAQRCVADLDSRKVACAASDTDAYRLAGAAPAATVKIAVFYDGANYGGSTFTWVQSRPCTAGYDNEWQWDNLASTPGGNWANRVSSVHTYNRCDVKFYDGATFTGASSTWIDQAANLATIGGGWSNRANSVKFS